MLRLMLGLILIALPMAELALLIKTGQTIGVWADARAGGGSGHSRRRDPGAPGLERGCGGRSRRWRKAGRRWRRCWTGLFLVLAGALLITPGFLSDALALLLLIPPVRRGVARWGVKQLVTRAHVAVQSGRRQDRTTRLGNRPLPARAKGPVIEGEFERLEEKATRPHRGKDRDRL